MTGKLAVTLLSTLSFGITSAAQKGTAPSGYFPTTYSGTTFTGKLTDVNPKTQEFTLIYDNGKKQQTFVGRLEAPCHSSAKGQLGITTVAEFPQDAVLTAFYNEVTHKVNGEKHKENVVIAVSVKSVGARVISDNERAITYCTNTTFMPFQAH